ncbi:Highly reducing polyketide synthase azaB-like protein [Elsinoe fawcettii]|nr:Highly reducing polyketide synthase azaB-like protein [Elsinoe fawcettii]
MTARPDDIAIIGMSCRAPGDATSPEKLWQLCVEGRNTWKEIPKDRFNKDAFYHPQGEHPGRSNVLGAHFLEEDVSLFDASFFGLSTEVAASMDPQFRLLLESTFEALENAGISMSSAAGSNTAVFGGSFFRDYYDSLMRDPGTLPRYCLTGDGTAMLSNQVSHFFDLRGPSVTVDTGCSTGLTALHLACQSLRTGEADMAVIGAANVLLNPDQFIVMSGLGFLGSTGKSFSFDDRAEGYGRGEGVATLIAKPLSAALRDSDPVRAVIKGTLLNQDGKTPTITSPSQEAQEALIKQCYTNAGLDPLDTQFIEAHGTGTKTGDKIEASALRNAFTKGRRRDEALYLSSVKANIGHLESASGIIAVIKTVKALETGIIPKSANYQNINPNIGLENSGMIVPTTSTKWPSVSTRRASISNFGYGGTNAHVIIEQSPYPRTTAINGHSGNTNGHTNGHTINGQTSNGDAISGGMDLNDDELWANGQILVLSGKDSMTTSAIANSLVDYLEHDAGLSPYFHDLVYTLNERRSRFSWTIAVAASDTRQIREALKQPTLKPVQASRSPRLGFVFTGQGAQWYAMGRELIFRYPVFRSSLQAANEIFRSFGAEWSLVDELLRAEQDSRVGEAALSMPISTAVQLALVDLLSSWGVTPNAVTGHSSGEASAAYAAGALDQRSALAVPYFRARLTTENISKLGLRGGMLAVGLGRDAVQPYLQQLTGGQVVIACVNSPTNVTISGDLEAISEVEGRLTEDKIFVRRLKVPAAYHSHHMQPMVAEYRSHLDANFSRPGPSFGKILYSSPLTGKMVWSAKQLGPQNWVNNMVMPVEFSAALENMCLGCPEPASSEKEQLVDLLIEIGPHGALVGPTRQILAQPHLKNFNIAQASCLERYKSATDTMQGLACLLVNKGYAINLAAVNKVGTASEKRRVLTDLPSYPWNHTTSYWMEPRINKQHRFRSHPIHDLLGARVLGGDDISPTWRHLVSVAQLPWLRDHVVQSEIVFPGAGYLAMAIEALQQISAGDEHRGHKYRLSKVSFTNALILQEDGPPVELQLRLQDRDSRVLDSMGWWTFQVNSVNNEGIWQEHCSGSITIQDTTARHFSSLDADHILNSSQTELDVESFYQGFAGRGISYGPMFKNIQDLRCGRLTASGAFSIADTASVMPLGYQQPHIVHPTTLDTLLQMTYGTLPDANLTMIPVKIEDLIISQMAPSRPGTSLNGFVHNHSTTPRGFHASLIACAQGSDVAAFEIHGLQCQAIGSALSEAEAHTDDGLCSTLTWNRDVAHISADEFDNLLQSPPDPAELARIADAKRVAFHLIHDAIKQLEGDDPETFEWYHKIMHSWMKLQVKLAQENRLAPNSARWLKTSQGVKQMLYEKVKAASVTGEMMLRIGHQLPGIFRKQVTPLEIMLEGKLLYRYYEKALRLEHAYGMVDKLVKLYRHKMPRAKILEIGGGTGGCTVPVLRALTEPKGDRKVHHFSQYTFTDVSSGFFDEARGKLSEWGSMINYQKLDIEQPPTSQGFVYGTYDLVVACCVLHATKNMQTTMTHVRKLLRPGGKLIMLDTTQDCLDMQIIFGTVPGWWLSEEPQRKHSPNLTIDFWQETLLKSGFSGLDASVKEFNDEGLPAAYALSLMMSTALPEHDRQPSPAMVSLIKVSEHDELASQLSERLVKQSEHRLRSATLHSAGPEVYDTTCIIVDDAEDALIGRMNGEIFTKLQEVITHAKHVVWVSTKNDTTAAPSMAAAVNGLFRVLRLENHAKRLISVDCDLAARENGAYTVQVLADILYRTIQTNETDCIDVEYAIQGKQVLVSRISESHDHSQFVKTGSTSTEPQLYRWGDETKRIQLCVESPGMLNTLRFEEVEEVDDLYAGLVEIQPAAIGLNFRDVMVALGQLDSQTMGFECSGTVTRVGKSCNHIAVGDSVMALMHGHWSNMVYVHESAVVKIPDDMDMATAASIPLVFATAYHSLYNIANLEAGESILIHAAAGGVGQAAIALAKLRNARIFATVGSTEKRQFLVDHHDIPESQIFSSRDASFVDGVLRATNGKGVDVILNSLSGTLLQETWRCIAELGRFVEIGKKDLEQSKYLDMNPFVKAASFTAVDMLHLARIKPQLTQRCLQDIVTLLKDQKISPISPLRTFALGDVGQAFRILSQGKHTGKLVVKMSADDTAMAIPKSRQLKLKVDASYAIIGGAGGLGQSLATLLAQKGAKHILLLSRTAGTTSSTQDLIKTLDAQGCQVHGFSCDVTDMASLSSALASVSAAGIPSVKGVLHGGMVLSDSIFDSMTFAQWEAATAPKIRGTMNLHAHFGSSLDFFVLLSSLCGIVGSPSQANYVAGGAFQDEFARWRSAQGLPAVSIDLSHVKSAGYVAENKGVSERLERLGFRELEEKHVWRVVEEAMLNPLRTPDESQVICSIAPWDAEEAGKVAWRKDAKFAALQRPEASATGAGVKKTASAVPRNLREQLTGAADWKGACEMIAEAVAVKLADMFSMSAEDIDRAAPVSACGVDSLVAVELRNWIFAMTQADVPIFEVLQSPSLTGLAAMVAGRSQTLRAAGLVAPR